MCHQYFSHMCELVSEILLHESFHFRIYVRLRISMFWSIRTKFTIILVASDNRAISSVAAFSRRYNSDILIRKSRSHRDRSAERSPKIREAVLEIDQCTLFFRSKYSQCAWTVLPSDVGFPAEGPDLALVGRGPRWDLDWVAAVGTAYSVFSTVVTPIVLMLPNVYNI